MAGHSSITVRRRRMDCILMRHLCIRCRCEAQMASARRQTLRHPSRDTQQTLSAAGSSSCRNAAKAISGTAILHGNPLCRPPSTAQMGPALRTHPNPEGTRCELRPARVSSSQPNSPATADGSCPLSLLRDDGSALSPLAVGQGLVSLWRVGASLQADEPEAAVPELLGLSNARPFFLASSLKGNSVCFVAQARLHSGRVVRLAASSSRRVLFPRHYPQPRPVLCLLLACCTPSRPDLDSRPNHFDSHLIWLQLQPSRDILAIIDRCDAQASQLPNILVAALCQRDRKRVAPSTRQTERTTRESGRGSAETATQPTTTQTGPRQKRSSKHQHVPQADCFL